MTATLKSIPGEEKGIRDTSAQDTPVDPSLERGKRRRLMLIAGAGALALVIVSVVVVRSWISTAVVVPRDRLRIAEVQRGKFIRDVSAEGAIVAAVSPTLFSSAPGTVTFLVKAGEAVKKGQSLATVDSPQFKNEFQQEEATLEGMNSGLERQSIEARRQILQSKQAADIAGVQIHAAERELKRAELAWQSHIIPEHDYAKAVDEVETARLTHEQALANAKLQEEGLNFELKTKRLERDRQRRVRFSKQIPAGLRQNQRVNLRIIMDSRDNVLKVERGAFTDAGDVAYVVTGDTATRRHIRIGAMSVSEVEILEGLAPGEKIIITSLGDFGTAATVRLSN